MKPFTDKVVVITGATSGIGKTTAISFAQAGAKVILAGRRETEGEQVVSEINQISHGLFVRCDVSTEADVESLISKAVAAFGRIDIAFNNAGVGGEITPLHEANLKSWQQVIAINQTGIFLCMKHQIAQMLNQESGEYSIINMASLWGMGASNMGASAYIASKHAVVGLTRAAALEYGANGIRVNAVCPAWVPTEANAPVLNNPQMREQITASHPLQKLGTQEEIAKTVMFLASKDAGFITGQAIMADGGISARL